MRSEIKSFGMSSETMGEHRESFPPADWRGAFIFIRCCGPPVSSAWHPGPVSIPRLHRALALGYLLGFTCRLHLTSAYFFVLNCFLKAHTNFETVCVALVARCSDVPSGEPTGRRTSVSREPPTTRTLDLKCLPQDHAPPSLQQKRKLGASCIP